MNATPWQELGSDEERVVLVRAHDEPPFVRSVRSVSFPDGSNTSNNPTPPLTCGSNTSDVSNILLAGVRNGTWLSETTFDPLIYAVPDILPSGFTVLAGPPKAGKSWLMLDWMLAIAAGGRALGQIPVGEPRRVLYFALEDSDRRMQARCNHVLQGGRIPELFHYETHVQPGFVQPTIEAWLDAYPDTALIGIDTLGKVMPAMKTGETTYQRDYRIGGALQALTVDRPGLSVTVAHHTRKTASADFVDSVSGTNGLAGAADTVIVLSRDRNSPEGALNVTGRDVEEAEYALTSAQGRWVIDGADLQEAASAAHDRRDVANLGNLSRSIVDFVAERPEGVSAKDVVAKFGNNAYTYLRRLEEEGHLCKPARGYYCLPVREAS